MQLQIIKVIEGIVGCELREKLVDGLYPQTFSVIGVCVLCYGSAIVASVKMDASGTLSAMTCAYLA